METFVCESEGDVANACLGVAEKLTGSRFGFIGFVNTKGKFDVVAISNPGWSQCKMPKSDATKLIKDMEIRGIWGEVIKRATPIVVDDPDSYEARVGLPEGHPALLSFMGVPLKHLGKTFGMIALGNKEGGFCEEDVSDIEALSGAFVEALMRTRAEVQLREHREHLEELVGERTMELEQAQADLLRNERLVTLGKLTATVSHEIRNPLSTIRTAVFSIGDAMEHGQSERIGRALKLAERNIVRCDKIIDELLNYTRTKGLSLEATPIDAWLESVLDELNEQETPEGIESRWDLRAGIELPVDREKLRRAVVNVYTNAVHALVDKSSADHSLTVATSVTGGRLEIRIIDTGSGIDPEVFDKIFEPLFSTKGFGVGLGLPIVKNTMKQHGGDIEIKSDVGIGTTVTLWLPTSEKAGGTS